MNGATILLLLGCGVIVSATYPRHRSQNINMNENTNILEDSPTSRDDLEKWSPSEDPDHTLDGKILDADSLLTSRVIEASEAAREILARYSRQCTESATNAVVETILNILMNRDSRKNRRNYNVNTNTNTNILGGVRDYERDSRGRQDLIYEKDLNRESSDDFVDLVNNKRTAELDLDAHHGYVIGSQFGPYRITPSDRQRIRSGSIKIPEDSSHPDEITLEKILETIREDAKAESLSESPSNELMIADEPWVISSLLRKNRNIDRRNAYDAYGTPNLRSSPRYDNANSNTNSNINSFRRNVNSNTNSNSNYNTNNYRRNMNSNSNTNVNTNNNRNVQRSPSRRY